MSDAAAPTAVTRVVNGRTVPVAGTYTFDPAHSSFEFVARHLMAKLRGRFERFTGTVHIAEVPEESSVEVEIDADSVNTREERRDAHLRSADFFKIEDHPKISFRSTAVRPGEEENRWLLDGDLTILGVTRPVTWDVEFHGATQDPWGGQRAAFSAWTEVERHDWGLSWNAQLETGGWLLARTARLEVEAELVRQS
jgi:polyisoprenoid-binding protein YceI